MSVASSAAQHSLGPNLRVQRPFTEQGQANVNVSTKPDTDSRAADLFNQFQGQKPPTQLSWSGTGA